MKSNLQKVTNICHINNIKVNLFLRLDSLENEIAFILSNNYSIEYNLANNQYKVDYLLNNPSVCYTLAKKFILAHS